MAQLWLLPYFNRGMAFEGVGAAESACVYAERGNCVAVGPHGENTVFAKNGSVVATKDHRKSVLYFEPFANMSTIQDSDSSLSLHPVSAIRPSFFENPVAYRNE
jgi:hypothetical protein